MRRFYPELTVLTTRPTARPKVAVNCQDSNLAILEPHVSYEALLHHSHALPCPMHCISSRSSSSGSSGYGGGGGGGGGTHGSVQSSAHGGSGELFGQLVGDLTRLESVASTCHLLTDLCKPLGWISLFVPKHLSGSYAENFNLVF